MFIDFFRERSGGERERKRNISVREKHLLVASCTQLGIEPAAFLVYRQMLQPTEPPSQGYDQRYLADEGEAPTHQFSIEGLCGEP